MSGHDFLFDLKKLEAGLLEIGGQAPDFRLPALAGGEVRLEEVLAAARAVLLSFWYVGCAGCAAALPRLQSLHEGGRERGLAVLAVNRGDPEPVIRAYLESGGFTFPVLLDGAGEEYRVGKMYGVRAYPTHYLLTAGRRVAWRRVGLHADELRAALTAAGVG